MNVALIMAGGSGERFWPLSREDKPKQLLKLFSDKTMVHETVDRILPIIDKERIFVATNIVQAEMIKKELSFLPEENIIIEPIAKDTAACIGYASLYIDNKYPDSTMVVLASDHVIKDTDDFRGTLGLALDRASMGEKIITLGIKPNRAETGYGYIEVDKDMSTSVFKKVKAFREKPNEDTAEKYLEAGNYLWNSGMFIWKTKKILDSIKEHMVDHGKIMEDLKVEIESNLTGMDLTNKIEKDFKKFEKISIDFGVLEKSCDVEVIPVDFGWNDVGSFIALEDIFPKNKNGTIEKLNNLIEVDSKNNIIMSDHKKKIVATVGVEDLIVIDTGDAILVCNKNNTQQIKKVVQKLKEGKV